VIPIEDDLRDWSKNVLEVPSKHLNGIPPCPYAKKAWIDNKVEIIEAEDIVITAIINAHKILDDQLDLVVSASYNIPDADTLQRSIEALNILGANKDLYFMCFHPDYGAEEADLDFVYEHDWVSGIEDDYCMVFVQRLSKVDDLSLQLEKQGYYNAFPEDEYQTLVLERRKRRHGYETKSNEQED
jgi:hypothetical protein